MKYPYCPSSWSPLLTQRQVNNYTLLLLHTHLFPGFIKWSSTLITFTKILQIQSANSNDLKKMLNVKFQFYKDVLLILKLHTLKTHVLEMVDVAC